MSDGKVSFKWQTLVVIILLVFAGGEVEGRLALIEKIIDLVVKVQGGG